MALLPIASSLGGLLSFFVAPMMGRKFDKKKTLIISTVLMASFFSLTYFLKMGGFFAESGNNSVLLVFMVNTMFAYIFISTVISISNSMMADIVDEYDLMTGNREEGLFFSTMSFAYKCTAGLGYFIAGLILNYIEFPKKVNLEDVPAEQLDALGIIGGPVLFTIYLLAIGFILMYPISKERYLEIRVALDARDGNIR